MHYRIQLHWPWFIVCNGKYFDTVFAFMKCYQYQLDYFLVPHWYCRPWHFAQFIVKGPWAKIARRYRTLLPLAGVGNTPTRRRKGLGHIFSVDTFANSDFGLLPCSVLRCTKKKKRIISTFFTQIRYPHSSSLIALSGLLRSTTCEPNITHTLGLNLCVLCNR